MGKTKPFTRTRLRVLYFLLYIPFPLEGGLYFENGGWITLFSEKWGKLRIINYFSCVKYRFLSLEKEYILGRFCGPTTTHKFSFLPRIPMLGQLRSLFKPFFSVLAHPFIALRINPMLVTLLGVPFALACAFAYATHQFWLALLLLPLSSLWDAIDGTVARAQKKESLWGNYFETMIDKLVEILIFIGLAFIAPVAAIAALGFGLWSSYAKPRVALVIIADNHDWPAIGEHADKMAILFVGTLASIFVPTLNGFSTLELSLWLIATVTLVGTLQRMAYAKKLIARAEKDGTILPYLKKGKER